MLDDASFSNKIAATCILRLHLRRVVAASSHRFDLLPKVDQASFFLSSFLILGIPCLGKFRWQKVRTFWKREENFPR